MPGPAGKGARLGRDPKEIPRAASSPDRYQSYGEVLGLAYVGSACDSMGRPTGVETVSLSPGGAGGEALAGACCPQRCHGCVSSLRQMANLPASYFAPLVAHEMGHNLGMRHDVAGCVCNHMYCIMNPTIQ